MREPLNGYNQLNEPMSNKDAKELAAFRKFVQVARLPIDMNSIQKVPPPSPDISCKDTSGIELAFELVELLDQDFASGMNWLHAEHLIRSAYEHLPTQERAGFDSLYGNADLYFTFAEGATMKTVARHARQILVALLRQAISFEGGIDTFADGAVSSIVRSITVSRGDFTGPCFSIANYIRVGDPTPRALNQKFTKSYQSRVPVELVAYIDRNLMFPDSVWRPLTENFFKRALTFGAFRKVWIVDLVNGKVEFEVYAA